VANGHGPSGDASAAARRSATPFSMTLFSSARFGTAVCSTLLCATLFSTHAQAQSGSDAGSPAPEQAPAAPAGAELKAPEPEAPLPGTTSPSAPKTLREGQRLPENLQSWLHDRVASRPPRIVRSTGSTTTAAVASPEREPDPVEDSRAVRSRRMRSFDEAGITVLSNRASQDSPSLARVEPTRVAAPAPLLPPPEPTEIEPDPEEEPSRVTETRSLRAGVARASVPRRSFDDGFGWATLAAGGSALGLAALWFRRRGRASRGE
jgi:hypothetical protein